MKAQLFLSSSCGQLIKCAPIFSVIVGVLAVVLLAGEPVSASLPANSQQQSISGWFHVIWIDNYSESRGSSIEYVLIDYEGNWNQMLFDQTLVKSFDELLAFNGKRVIITGEKELAAQHTIHAHEIKIEQLKGTKANNDSVTPSAVIGPQPWVTILCRFADFSSVTPHSKSWFETLMGSSYPGMDHYWREASYNTINLMGSNVVGWYNLPQPLSYYRQGSFMDSQKMVDDCTAVADADVFFPNFMGINLMFNTNYNDCCVWAGGTTMSKDGQTKTYGVTWMQTSGPGCWPNWNSCNTPATYEVHGIFAHEMGHVFGLPHSSGPYDQTYDSKWDIMSDGGRRITSCCPRPPYDPEYGALGVHTISYHKDRLGWIPSSRKFVPTPGSSQTITIERLAQPPSNNNYLMAQIPLLGSNTRYYTLEARRFVGYDDTVPSLPGEAIIIHKVDTTRSDRLAQIVDVDDNGDPNDAGAMWTVGETFTDTTNQLKVTVNSATPSGYVVTIEYLPDFVQKGYLPLIMRSP